MLHNSLSAVSTGMRYLGAGICVVRDETYTPVTFDTAAESPLWQLVFSINITYIVTGCPTHSSRI